MSKKIAIKRAEEFAKAHDLKQVIIFGWDGETTHILTYGDTIEACAQAAEGANRIKRKWGWPEELITEPSRVQNLLNKIKRLEEQLAAQQPVMKDEAVPFVLNHGPVDYTAFVVEWTEMERGWGQRPEGYLLFQTEKEADAFICEETKDRNARGPVPDCYDLYEKRGLKKVSAQVYSCIGNADHRRLWMKDLKNVIDDH